MLVVVSETYVGVSTTSEDVEVVELSTSVELVSSRKMPGLTVTEVKLDEVVEAGALVGERTWVVDSSIKTVTVW